MTPVLLIAANFVREQRWVVAVLLLWVAANGALFALAQQDPADDLLTFVKLQAAYGVALSVFLAAPAIHNERRSRRILSVLSKAVERSHYLAGLLCGVLAVAAFYGAAIAAAGGLLFYAAGLPLGDMLLVLLLMMVAALLAAAVTLLFAIWLPPLPATAAAVLALATPPVVAHVQGAPAWLHLLPVYAIVMNIMQWSAETTWQPAWLTLLLALPQIVLAWMVAGWSFQRRDIAVAVE